MRLKPTLADPSSPADYFTPSNWSYLDATDLDLGGTSAIPLDVPVALGSTAPRVLALGKDGNAYLLNRRSLGGIGGQIAVAQVASNRIISAMAAFPTSNSSMVAVGANGSACGGNLLVLSVTANAISTAWCASFNGDGAPIVTTSDGSSDPIVWVVGANGGNALYGFDGATGQAVVIASGGPNSDCASADADLGERPLLRGGEWRGLRVQLLAPGRTARASGEKSDVGSRGYGRPSRFGDCLPQGGGRVRRLGGVLRGRGRLHIHGSLRILRRLRSRVRRRRSARRRPGGR